MTGFADMVGSKISGAESLATSDISSLGGSTAQGVAFAAKMCTKLGACEAHEISGPSNVRTR